MKTFGDLKRNKKHSNDLNVFLL